MGGGLGSLKKSRKNQTFNLPAKGNNNPKHETRTTNRDPQEYTVETKKMYTKTVSQTGIQQPGNLNDPATFLPAREETFTDQVERKSESCTKREQVSKRKIEG